MVTSEINKLRVFCPCRLLFKFSFSLQWVLVNKSPVIEICPLWLTGVFWLRSSAGCSRSSPCTAISTLNWFPCRSFWVNVTYSSAFLGLKQSILNFSLFLQVSTWLLWWLVGGVSLRASRGRIACQRWLVDTSGVQMKGPDSSAGV